MLEGLFVFGSIAFIMWMFQIDYQEKKKELEDKKRIADKKAAAAVSPGYKYPSEVPKLSPSSHDLFYSIKKRKQYQEKKRIAQDIIQGEHLSNSYSNSSVFFSTLAKKLQNLPGGNDFSIEKLKYVSHIYLILIFFKLLEDKYGIAVARDISALAMKKHLECYEIFDLALARYLADKRDTDNYRLLSKHFLHKMKLEVSEQAIQEIAPFFNFCYSKISEGAIIKAPEIKNEPWAFGEKFRGFLQKNKKLALVASAALLLCAILFGPGIYKDIKRNNLIESGVVWYVNDGNTYHLYSNCSNMVNPKETTERELQWTKSRRRCSKCYRGLNLDNPYWYR